MNSVIDKAFWNCTLFVTMIDLRIHRSTNRSLSQSDYRNSGCVLIGNAHGVCIESARPWIGRRRPTRTRIDESVVRSEHTGERRTNLGKEMDQGMNR